MQGDRRSIVIVADLLSRRRFLGDRADASRHVAASRRHRTAHHIITRQQVENYERASHQRNNRASAAVGISRASR